MPDQRLKRFGVRRYSGFAYDRNQHASVRDLFGKTAIAANDSANRGPYIAGVLKSLHQVGANVVFCVATADGKNKDHVLVVQPGAPKPIGITSVPALVVHACGEFGHIIRGRVSLDLSDLAEIADCMR